VKYFLLIAIAGSFFAGCGDDHPIPKPEPLLDEEVYLQLMVELKLVNAIVQTTDSTVSANVLKDRLFEYYNIEEQIFLDNHTYYQSFPEQQKIRLDSASARLLRVLTQLQENDSTENQFGVE
jgi:hypothetical protein